MNKNIVIFLIVLLSILIVAPSDAQQKARKVSSTKTTCPATKQKSSCPYSNSNNQCPASVQMDLSSQSLFDEVNYARTNPKEYAKILESRLNSYSGGEKTTCKEAIDFLKKQPNRKAYIFSRALGQAAFDHCKDMSDKNFFSHTGSNGSNPTQRINKYGSINTWAENISAGTMTSRDAVVNWIIDHGVSNRGHRKAIYSDDYIYLGIAWYTHPKWRATQTADFATANFTSKMQDDNVMFEFVKMNTATNNAVNENTSNNNQAPVVSTSSETENTTPIPRAYRVGGGN
jgi:uncharacterized protein YkwD